MDKCFQDFQDLYHSLESCSNKKHAQTRRCRYMHRPRGLGGVNACARTPTIHMDHGQKQTWLQPYGETEAGAVPAGRTHS